ncbi:hypothetical protein GUJ93_ZPchr0003g18045 [Zizania palustris]|uniref:Uncharacterized protein n=1 Tax=Zizania palustris TaxID=103762 RepID=A0A8J5SCN8_ZIZPA|nr:hypothetical protein GUJ93_ZPchr0003g18045 [Zizania palustris]
MVADLDNPTLRPEVDTVVGRAAKHIRARCAGRAAEEIAGIELDPHAHRALGGRWDDDGHAFISDDDEDGSAAQMTVRPYHGSMAREGGPSDGTLLLSGFVARSDGPELTDQHELTPRDMERLVGMITSGERRMPSPPSSGGTGQLGPQLHP